MAKLTLLYFPSPGRGEAIRDALRIGKIAFEDRRIPFDEFKRMKAAGELPFGLLPVLIVDGPEKRTLTESNAILRYAGKLAGLYPTDGIEALRVDELLDVAEAMNAELGPSMREPDKEKKLAMRQVLVAERFPFWLTRLEGRLRENASASCFVGSALSIADLKLLHVLNKLVDGSLDGVPTTVLDPYAALVAWRSKAQAARDARIA